MLNQRDRAALFLLVPTALCLCLLSVAILNGDQASETPSDPKGDPKARIQDTVADGPVFIEQATVLLGEREKEKKDLSWAAILSAGGVALGAIFTWNNKRSEERRLRVEAINRSAEFLKQDSVGPKERATVLFSLIRLEEYDFALEMVRMLWASREITSGAAVWVIDQILQIRPSIFPSKQERLDSLKDYATVALWQHSSLLLDENGSFEWPTCVEWRWDERLSFYARKCILRTIMDVFCSRRFDSWEKRWIDSLLTTLKIVHEEDNDSRHRYRSACIMLAVLHHYSEKWNQVVINSEKVDVATLVAGAQKAIRKSNLDDEKMDDHFEDGMAFLRGDQWKTQERQLRPKPKRDLFRIDWP